MGVDSPPGEAWLQSLQVRHWLQIPPHERQLNAVAGVSTESGNCQTWPLNQTGAVDIHFEPGQDGESSKIILRPWLALPERQ